MNKVVKYDNYMNSLNFKCFTGMDFNFLMALCNRLRNMDTAEIEISFKELKEITKYKRTSVVQFVSDLKRMNQKLMGITCNLETTSEILMFVLFPTFKINVEEQILTVSVNRDFKFILNEITRNFTRFDLQEFTELDSKYAKTMYRLLKQYRSTGLYTVSVEKFREIMDCPVCYTNKQFMQCVVNPAVKNLQSCFRNLRCETQYSHRRGNPVTGYAFTFTPEIPGNSEEGQEDNKDGKYMKAPDRYGSFHQRSYDYDALEQELLSRS